MLRSNCPLCKAADPKILRHIELEMPQPHPLLGGFNVAVCKSCGFGYLDEVATQADYDLYYKTLSRYEDTKIGIGLGLFGEDAERAVNIAETVSSGIPDRNARIMDIGCANGGLLGQLKKLGYTNLTGMDPSPICARNAKALYEIDVFSGSLSSPAEGIGLFDGLTLSHVAEHVADVDSIVPALKSLLKEDGIIYIEVPDAWRYPDAVLGPLQEFNIEHINYFSLEHLVYMFARHGMTLIGSGKRRTPAHQGSTYPVVHAFFKRSSASELETTPAIPESMEAPLLEYIKVSDEWISRIDAKLTRDLAELESVAIWGAGQLLMKILKLPSLRNQKISAIVDTNSVNYGKLLRGVPIAPPDTLKDSTEPVLITTLNFANEIEAQIHAMPGNETRKTIHLAAKP